MDEVAEDQKGLREEHRGLREGQKGLREDVQQGFAQVNGRLDNMIEFMGAAHGDHERRIRALETEVFKKSG